MPLDKQIAERSSVESKLATDPLAQTNSVYAESSTIPD